LLRKTLEQLRRMPRLGLRGYGIADVEVFARQGETERALRTLRQAIDEGYRAYWRFQGEGSPHMASIKEEPEFKSMMDELRADMVRQLSRVHEMNFTEKFTPANDMTND